MRTITITITIGKHLFEISLFGQINYGQFLDCQRVKIIAGVMCGKRCPKREGGVKSYLPIPK